MKFELFTVLTYTILVKAMKINALHFVIYWPVAAFILFLVTAHIGGRDRIVTGAKEWLITVNVYYLIVLAILLYFYNIPYPFFKITDGFLPLFIVLYVFNIIATVADGVKWIDIPKLVLIDFQNFQKTILYLLEKLLLLITYLFTFPVAFFISKYKNVVIGDIHTKLIEYVLICFKIYLLFLSYTIGTWLFFQYLSLCYPLLDFFLVKQSVSLLLLSLYHPLYLVFKYTIFWFF